MQKKKTSLEEALLNWHRVWQTHIELPGALSLTENWDSWSVWFMNPQSLILGQKLASRPTSPCYPKASGLASPPKGFSSKAWILTLMALASIPKELNLIPPIHRPFPYVLPHHTHIALPEPLARNAFTYVIGLSIIYASLHAAETFSLKDTATAELSSASDQLYLAMQGWAQLLLSIETMHIVPF
jgi:hypothetical protein